MDTTVRLGTYVVAVSGGVDSVVLLDLLSKQTKPKFLVAHLDHGIRQDSHLDRQLVQKLSKERGLPFVYSKEELGPKASEAVAREARYKFLHHVKNTAGARAIITAHHQDDLIETAIINMLRGTGRSGLTSLKSREGMFRPLLNVPKQVLVSHAKARGLKWNEDVTNKDTSYLRNHVRQNIMPKLTVEKRREFVKLLNRMGEVNDEIDIEIVNLLHVQPATDEIDKHWFTMLPHTVALETMASWLRARHVTFDKKLLQKLTISAKTLSPDKQLDVNKDYFIRVHKDKLALVTRTDDK